MQAIERHIIKEALRKARWQKGKERGKKTNLTRQEAFGVINGIITLNKFMAQNKTTWQGISRREPTPKVR